MELVIILLLILLNGIFSMSEIAIVSARKSRLEAAAKRGDRSAKAALDTANSPNRFFSTVQIGITLIGILTGIYSGENITGDLRILIERIPLLQPYAQSIAVAGVVVIITYLSLVIGELVPKRIGLTNPEGIAKLVARPMQLLSTATAPFVWLLTITTDLIIKIFRITPSADSKVTEEEIKAIIQEGTDGGAIDEIEQDIVERVFNLGDRTVSSLMTHRSDIVSLRTDFDAATTRKRVDEELHSVYPIMEGKTEDVAGIVFLKDLFRYIDEPKFSIVALIRQPQYITEGLSAYEALKLFKSTKVHQALVIDEFGQMQGLVTMNDLLEALVGDVGDFYSNDFAFTEREDGSWLIDGQYPMAEFLRRFDLDERIEEYPFNTLSGLILHELRKIPVAGDTLEWANFKIEVVDMDGARIDKVMVSTVKEAK